LINNLYIDYKASILVQHQGWLGGFVEGKDKEGVEDSNGMKEGPGRETNCGNLHSLAGPNNLDGTSSFFINNVLKTTLNYTRGGGSATMQWHNSGYQDRVKVGLGMAKTTINNTCDGIGATT
jgi:hypothetical protein